ncbi:hypothetical protein J2736_000433 [Paenibacillus qinlingensis]|uniref:Uncharacterized protein n=1 Tax=Paenibacillus qinlingensis TaxID=1837343 RepID=A0ABU1NP47_9BACL|nr:hypothetical protein [Paenibacillus qinlingensis]
MVGAALDFHTRCNRFQVFVESGDFRFSSRNCWKCIANSTLIIKSHKYMYTYMQKPLRRFFFAFGAVLEGEGSSKDDFSVVCTRLRVKRFI